MNNRPTPYRARSSSRVAATTSGAMSQVMGWPSRCVPSPEKSANDDTPVILYAMEYTATNTIHATTEPMRYTKEHA